MPRDFRKGRRTYLNPPRHKEFIEQELSELEARLSLTKDQAEQIRQILIKNSAPGPFMIPRMSRNLERWVQRIKKEEEEKDKAIENILNEEQKLLYQQIKEERTLPEEPSFPRRPRKRK